MRLVARANVRDHGEILVQNAHTTILRERRGTQPALIRIPTSDCPTAADLARLRYDHCIARSLNLRSVLKACALEEEDGTVVSVMEDFAGGTLRSLLAAGEIRFLDAFALAMELAKALDELHRSGIVHKSVDPSNIFVHRDTMQVKWTHFDNASRLPREPPARASPDRLEGSLATISPEQTGLMNRAVDHRADLYSLGVVLYELFTGRLPFRAADPRALVHSHVAVMPEPPERVRPTIARPASQIVMRLLAKDPEDRYQSAGGLSADLSECLEQIKTVLTLRDFIPGIQDIPKAVQIPQKLYDREREKAVLVEAFQRAGQGAAELVLVSGGSGTGKSALVQELYASVVEQRGYYAAGQFDESDRRPYAALGRALHELIDEVMQESEEEIAALRDRLLSALGCHRSIILELFPRAALLLGAQSRREVLDLPLPESSVQLALQRFVGVFASPEHPLVLLLDDVQWADSASLKLLQPLLQNPDIGYLLLVCAYRDTDLDEAHPLSNALAGIREARPGLREITLQPLSAAAERMWVAGALCTDEPSIALLSHLIHESSRGNPLRFGQTLAELARQACFVLAPHSGVWTWDLKYIEQRLAGGGADNLPARALERLPPRTQKLLVLAACLGRRFDLKTLAIVYDRSQHQTALDLWEALHDGLVVPLSSNYRFAGNGHGAPPDDPAGALDLDVAYMFAHEEIYKAAWDLAEDAHRRKLCLHMGRLLRAAHGDRAPDGGHLFLIPALLNRAAGHIEDSLERTALARWNLAAGHKARLGHAYDEAVGYLGAGLSLLSSPASWEEDYDLTFALHLQAAQCEYARGRPDRAEPLCLLLLSRAKSDVERAQVYDLAIVHHVAEGRYDDALSIGQAALVLLGSDGLFGQDPRESDLGAALAEVQHHLAGRFIAGLIDAAPMSDPGQRTALQILIHLEQAARRTSLFLYVCCVARQVGISLKHGRSDLSAHGYTAYGALLAVRFGNARDGFQFGKLGLDLNDLRGDVHSKCRLTAIFGLYSHLAKPFRWTLPYLEQGAQAGLESGDFQSLSSVLPLILTTRAHLGEDLRTFQAEVGKLLALARRTGDAVAIALLTVGKQRVANLLGRTRQHSSLNDDSFDEAAFEAMIEDPALSLAAAYYYTVKLELAFLYGDYALALAMAGEANQRAASCEGHSFRTDTTLFTCLTLAALHPTALPAAREPYLDAIRRHSAALSSWAEACPANYSHKDLLVRAELARICGDTLQALNLYDKALDAAAENGFPHHEALGNELCAKAYLLEGREKSACVYMIDALECYGLWGAAAKVSELQKRYPHLIFQITPVPGHPSDQPSSGPPTGRRASVRPPSGLVHMSSVVAASQGISTEITLQELLPKLLTILLEHSGALRGVLWLPGDQPLVVEPDPSKGGAPAVAPAVSFETRTDLPHGILRVVERSLESVVLTDAAGASAFQSDRYISRYRPRSVLCMPIAHQGKLTGVLYLENSLITNLFTPEKCEVMNVLCTQAAISIANARRYDALDTLVTERNHELSETALRLKETQQRLLMQEKRASLGSLASGIAHEIKNPLNFVTNFAELSVSIATDLSSEIDGQNTRLDPKSLAAIHEMIADLQQNSEKIMEHGKRADGIVKAMLDYSRTGSEAEKRSYDIHVLLREYITLAYQGIRAQNPSFHVLIETSYAQGLPLIHVVPQDIGRVILNLVQNACYALDARKKEAGQGFVASIKISTRDLGSGIELRVRDNGGGIPEAVRARIFQAFFTTKPPGEGTGLGLSICHEIVVEGHGGTLRFETEDGQFTEFIVTLPTTLEDPQESS